MGNICCGGKEESKKGAFLAEERRDDINADINYVQKSPTSGLSAVVPVVGDGGLLPHSALTDAGTNPNAALSAAEQKLSDQASRALRQEQARAKVIVQETGRAMVAVRSTRGSTVYYDQGFAAALSQHLEQTTQFPDHVPAQLPPAPVSLLSSSRATGTAASPTKGGGADGSSSTNAVYAILSQPEWEGIAVGPKDGLAGCAGENPVKYMNHICEQFLDSLIPKKERLFAKAPPIMENLL